jgi:hypothetical protein
MDIGKIHPFELPYYDMVPADPSMEQMHDVVCTQQRRPTAHNVWMENDVIQTISINNKNHLRLGLRGNVPNYERMLGNKSSIAVNCSKGEEKC